MSTLTTVRGSALLLAKAGIDVWSVESEMVWLYGALVERAPNAGEARLVKALVREVFASLAVPVNADRQEGNNLMTV